MRKLGLREVNNLPEVTDQDTCKSSNSCLSDSITKPCITRVCACALAQTCVLSAFRSYAANVVSDCLSHFLQKHGHGSLSFQMFYLFLRLTQVNLMCFLCLIKLFDKFSQNIRIQNISEKQKVILKLLAAYSYFMRPHKLKTKL